MENFKTTVEYDVKTIESYAKTSDNDDNTIENDLLKWLLKISDNDVKKTPKTTLNPYC